MIPVRYIFLDAVIPGPIVILFGVGFILCWVLLVGVKAFMMRWLFAIPIRKGFLLSAAGTAILLPFFLGVIEFFHFLPAAIGMILILVFDYYESLDGQRSPRKIPGLILANLPNSGVLVAYLFS